MTTEWLHVRRGNAPLIVSFPHAGTWIPEGIERRLSSPWLARKDTDWWVDRLYEFAQKLGATTIMTEASRTVVDVNRDPSGASLYPGLASTGLCPLTTFDGEDLYLPEQGPDAKEIAERQLAYFDPYHSALAEEINRHRSEFGKTVLFDAHSIRSTVPRLFDGVLPHFNVGTNNGETCASELAASIEMLCSSSGLTTVVNGRFRGGWTTRHYGKPARGVHAVQMELACRTYMDEPQATYKPGSWPTQFSDQRAKHVRRVLSEILTTCIHFANS